MGGTTSITLCLRVEGEPRAQKGFFFETCAALAHDETEMQKTFVSHPCKGAASSASSAALENGLVNPLLKTVGGQSRKSYVVRVAAQAVATDQEMNTAVSFSLSGMVARLSYNMPVDFRSSETHVHFHLFERLFQLIVSTAAKLEFQMHEDSTLRDAE